MTASLLNTPSLKMSTVWQALARHGAGIAALGAGIALLSACSSSIQKDKAHVVLLTLKNTSSAQAACPNPVCPVADAQVYSFDAGARLSAIGRTDKDGRLDVTRCGVLSSRNRLLLACKEGFTCGVIDLCFWGESWCHKSEGLTLFLARNGTHGSQPALDPPEAGDTAFYVLNEAGEPLAGPKLVLAPSVGGLWEQGVTGVDGTLRIPSDEIEALDPRLVLVVPPGGHEAAAVITSGSGDLLGKTTIVIVPAAPVD